jgi:hypothetical protein
MHSTFYLFGKESRAKYGVYREVEEENRAKYNV